MTKHFAVVGNPISQSLSPKIHKAAYEFLGLDNTYTAHEVEIGGLRNFLNQNQALSGVSVTMPLKIEAFRLSDNVDEVAYITEVVNTVLIANSEYYGFNTDVFGITKAVEHLNVKYTAIIGSGATARSAIYAMQHMEQKPNVKLFARNQEEAGKLAAKFSVEVGDISTYQGGFDLVINTVPALAILNSGYVLNTSYSKEESLASNEISGKEMLLWQALAQLRIFINGTMSDKFEDESGLMLAMRHSLS